MIFEGVVFVLMALLVVGIVTPVTFFRHKRAVLRHEERMAVIEKGGLLPALDEERPKAPWTPRVYLLRGMLWLFVGIAIGIVLISVSVSTAHPASIAGRLSEAQSLREHGATEEQVKEFLAEERMHNNGLPIGAASVGLIPIGVGLAYLLFYRKETQDPRNEPGRSGDRFDDR